MSHPAAHDAELDSLIAAYCDGRLDDAARATLTRRVESDRAAMDALIDYMQVHAHVRWTLNAGARASTRPAAAPALRPPTPTLRPPKRLVLPLAAALLLAAAAVTIYLVALNSKPETRNSKPAAPAPIATVTDADGVAWDTEPLNAGQEIAAGDIRTGGGRMELMLRSGAMIAVTGPSELRLIDPMHVAIARGSATFTCPHDAVGFTVDAPGGLRIVDLGTEFAVEAGGQGDGDGHAAQVNVREGSVRITHSGQDATLVAGQVARVIDRRLLVLESLPLVNASFEEPIAPAGGYLPLERVPGWSAEGIAGVHRLGPLMGDEADGVQAAFLAWDNYAPITQTLDVRVGEHGSYELTAMAGLRRDETETTQPTVALELRDADTGDVLASAQTTLTERGRWTPITVRYVPGPDAAREHRLAIAFRRVAGVGQVQFDAVRLLVPRHSDIEHDTPGDPGR